MPVERHSIPRSDSFLEVLSARGRPGLRPRRRPRRRIRSRRLGRRDWRRSRGVLRDVMRMAAAGSQCQRQQDQRRHEPAAPNRKAIARGRSFPARPLHASPRFNFSSSFSGIIGTAKNSGKDTHCLSPFAGAGDLTGSKKNGTRLRVPTPRPAARVSALPAAPSWARRRRSATSAAPARRSRSPPPAALSAA
jgi:hypothetical protein